MRLLVFNPEDDYALTDNQPQFVAFYGVNAIFG